MATKEQLCNLNLSTYVVTSVDIELSNFNGKVGLSSFDDLSEELELTGFSKNDQLNISYSSDESAIYLQADDHKTSVDCKPFLSDRYVTSVWYDSGSKEIIIQFNDKMNSLSVPVDDMIHTYSAGTGIEINENSIKLSSNFDWSKKTTTIGTMFEDVAKIFSRNMAN